MESLSDAEIREIICGIKNGFSDMQFFGRFLEAFMLSVRMRSNSPIDALFTCFKEELNIKTADELAKDLTDPLYRKNIKDRLTIEMSKNRLSGQIISNLTAACVEAHLQSGTYFTQGIKTNDLLRVLDRSRWEIKGSRKKSLNLTINQSHVNIFETTFLVYCGLPEENELYSIYYIKGEEYYFSKPKTGLNLRTLLPEYRREAIQLYP